MAAGLTLWLQRHAAVLCAPGLCYGRTDVAADAQATAVAAQALAEAAPPGVAVWRSPLGRCAQLADALAALRPDLGAARIDPRLAEMDFGAWEGLPWSAIARSDFEAWMADFADARPGGDGESTRRFMQRVAAAWADWRASARPAVWITHSGVIRAVELIAQGRREVRAASDWPAAPLAMGALRRIDA